MSKIKLSLYYSFGIIIFILSIFYIQNFRIDASSDTLVAQNDEEFKYFNSYNKLFDSENFLVLAIKKETDIDREFIINVENISKELLKLQQVSKVFSFIDAPILFLNNTSLSDLSGNKIENLKNSNYEIEKVISEFIDNPVYVDQIINKNGSVFSIIIYLKKDIEFNIAKNDYENNIISKKTYLEKKNIYDKKRNGLIRNIRSIIDNADNNHLYYLGGVDMIANDVIAFVKSDIVVFSFAVIIIIILVLFFIFRQISWVIVCLLSSSYTIVLVFGMLGLLQIEITAISSNFAALIFILSVSMNIHIINYFRLLQNNKNKINKTLKYMFWPCLYTTLTTMVAFGSLIITDIKPIIDFGFIMVISLIISLCCSFTILPLFILLFFSNKESNYQQNILNINFFSGVKNHPKIIILTGTILFIIFSLGSFKLGIENSFVNYFKKNTEIYKGMKLIDEELGGTTPIDIILTFNNNELLINNNDNLEIIEDDIDLEDEFSDDDFFNDNLTENWFSEEKIEIISNIHNYLEEREEIGKVQSILSLIELANQINKKPLNLFELAVLYEEIPEEYKEDLIYPFLLVDKNLVKISARVKDSRDINRKKLIVEIKNFIEKNKNKSLQNYRVNGLLVLYNNMLDSLFESQIKSLGFVLVLIFFMFLVLFKSLKLSILGIIPNIFASTFILGIIGYLSIPLDIMTITIAAITIGIAVDNTIHYLYRFIEYKKNNTMTQSINLTNNSVGIAVLTTSITIALGFSVLILSSFTPTVIFGLFTSMAMIFAMIGVLVFLPSLLLLSEK